MVLKLSYTLQAVNLLCSYLQQVLHEISQSCCESRIWVADRGVTWIPSIAIQETRTEIILEARMLNVRMDSLDIRVTPEKVVIRGEQQEPVTRKSYYDFEFCPGWFESAIPLPEIIKPEETIAEFKQDFLILIFKKTKQQPNEAFKLNVHNGTVKLK